MRLVRMSTALISCQVGLVLIGCGQVSSVQVVPGVEAPDTVARQAIAAYDADGDGFLVGPELEACPGMLWNLGGFDSDGDKRLSDKEIAARVGQWLDHGVGVMTFACQVTLNGEPLQSAVVRLEPEAFLGPNVKAAVGTSDSLGNALVSIDPSDLPAGHQQRRVVQPGLYKVRITHPDIRLPDQYNEQTMLGCEVAFDLNRLETPEFKLTTR